MTTTPPHKDYWAVPEAPTVTHGTTPLSTSHGTGAAAAIARERAATLVCAFAGCCKAPVGLSRWCKPHLTIHKKYGHVLAKALPVGRGRLAPWAKERAEVAAIVNKNKDTHLGIQSGLQRLGALITMHVAGSAPSKYETVDGRTFVRTVSAQAKLDAEFRRMKDHGTTPLAILIEAAAVRLWMERTAYRTYDLRHEDYTLSFGILRLTPRPRDLSKKRLAMSSNGMPLPPEATVLAYLGRTVRECLSVLLVNLVQTCQSLADKATADHNARVTRDRTPFET